MYSLQDTEDPSSQLFTINPVSGVVQTRASLDREVKGFVRLTAVASDKVRF